MNSSDSFSRKSLQMGELLFYTLLLSNEQHKTTEIMMY